MPEEPVRLYLVDLSSYIFRAFHAIPPLHNKDGLPTNAVLGVANMLLKLLADERPDRIGVVFDAGGPTFRDELYDAYKANREEMPGDLRVQLPYVRKLVEAFRLPSLEVPGVEADDVIATLTMRFASEDVAVTIVTGDKDLMQLVGPQVTLLDTMRDRRIGVDEVRKRFGVEPSQVADILGLMGDAVDNLPGVKGIGEKTAQALIAHFGSVEALLGRLDEVEALKIRGAKRIRERLEQDAAMARLSRELAELDRGVAVEATLDSLRVQTPDFGKVRPLLLDLGFRSLLNVLAQLATRESRKSGTTGWIETREALAVLLEGLARRDRIAIEAVLGKDGSALEGLALGLDEEEACVVRLGGEGAPTLGDLAPLLAAARPAKIGGDLKGLEVRLVRAGASLGGFGFDTGVASYVANPSRASHRIEDVALELLGWRLVTDADESPHARVEEAAERARTAFALERVLRETLERQEQLGLFLDMEMPLLEVLARMEIRGVRVDVARLAALGAELESRMEVLLREIHDEAGIEFNVSSTPQLREVLFHRLKISTRGVRKGKTGFSTDVDVLTRLAKEHPLPAKILDYRSLAKLKSTYVDALPALVDPVTGRIHTSFNQTVAATGRLSSSDPNLQNIPVRTEEGRRIRAAFVPAEGCRLVSADYSQIELRILAHLSGDPTLIESFRTGEDIHTRTAAEVFAAGGAVTPEQRRAAKVINFGIIYGMGSARLSRELEIPYEEAEAYIRNYFARYPGVSHYVKTTLEEARRNGWVATLFGRRRFIPDLASPEGGARQFAERTAVNTPIQGTAADLIKAAMVRIDRRLVAERLRTAMILQVHDELILEAPAGEAETVQGLLREEMEGVAQLEVPLKVAVGIGDSWADLSLSH